MGFYSNVVFPRVIDWLMDDRQMNEQRQMVLQGVRGDVLEIGFGTGLNLPHYPDSVRKLTVLDPNAGMKARAQARIAASPIEVESLVLGGENLPMDDQSFDTIVCTWTMCSIPDLQKALSETHRVLRPGGQFVFIEHGLSPDPDVEKWQNRVNPLWRRVGDGCNLNRPIDKCVEEGGLQLAELETFYMPKTPRFMGYMFRGTANKAE